MLDKEHPLLIHWHPLKPLKLVHLSKVLFQVLEFQFLVRSLMDLLVFRRNLLAMSCLMLIDTLLQLNFLVKSSFCFVLVLKEH